MKFLSRMDKKGKIIGVNKRLVSEASKTAIEHDSGLKAVSSKTIVNYNPRAKIPPAVIVFQAFAYLAATKLRPATNRVLLLLFSMTAYENYIGMDIKTISENLEMSDRSVISALNELEKNKIILKIKHPSDKRRNDYFINPTAVWKGSGTKRLKSIKSFDPKQLSLFGNNILK
jgi:hypothetical protein